jgi:transcriptional regulator with XRE-family HTH domain
MEEFAVRLQRLRESKRPLRSRRVTSELIGLSTNALQKYERGEAIPMADSLAKIADYYKVSADYLLGRTNYR